MTKSETIDIIVECIKSGRDSIELDCGVGLYVDSLSMKHGSYQCTLYRYIPCWSLCVTSSQPVKLISKRYTSPFQLSGLFIEDDNCMDSIKDIVNLALIRVAAIHNGNVNSIVLEEGWNMSKRKQYSWFNDPRSRFALPDPDPWHVRLRDYVERRGFLELISDIAFMELPQLAELDHHSHAMTRIFISAMWCTGCLLIAEDTDRVIPVILTVIVTELMNNRR